MKVSKWFFWKDKEHSQTKQLFCMIYVQKFVIFSTHVHKLSFSTRSFNCIFVNSLQPIICQPYSYQLNSFGLLFSTLLPSTTQKKLFQTYTKKPSSWIHHSFLIGGKRWWNGLGGSFVCCVEGSIGKFLRLWERTCWQSSMVYQVAESCQGVFRWWVGDGNFYGTRKRGVG